VTMPYPTTLFHPFQTASKASVALFHDKTIRRLWHEERWFFSVVDVVGLLSESAEPRRYWSDLKRRVRDEGYRELYAKCVQLKMPAPDGKPRATDAADAPTLLRIVQSIPSPAAEPVKQWLASVGTTRLEEMESPSRAVERARALYARQGYRADWIEKRLQGMAARQELTEEWRTRGAEAGGDFAQLTDLLAKGTFGVSEDEHKAHKGLERRHNLRDSMTTLELALTTLAEATTTAIHQAHDSQGLPALRQDVREAGNVAGAARRDIEARTGQQVVSAENYVTLTDQRVADQREQPPAALPEAARAESEDEG
ncbi:MAG: Bro-N domain-containing protein, partial [Ktedonobacterales bacterium]|nr:Bro-N domain-containing protein [Ktedonobacterales bacterium]